MSVGYLPPNILHDTPLAILNPTDNFKPGTRYQVIVYGGKSGVLAEDGSNLSGVTDATARFKDKKVIWSFTTAAAN
jgi:hypothetical protein